MFRYFCLLCPAWLILAPWLTPAARCLADEHYFDSAGVRIRYTDEGAGPPVILIHGFSASGDLNWRLPGVIGLLKDDYRVVTLDNRGHGRSDKPEAVDDYGPKMAEDVLRLMDHLEIAQAHLVGYSMGGMISFKVAALAPERVLSAVIGGMGWIELGPAGPEAAGDQHRGSQALKSCARAFPTLGLTRQQLRELSVPLTIIIGDDDPWLARRVEPLKQERPDIPVKLIAGANHVNCVMRAEFREAILETLKQQAARQPAG